MTLDKWEEQYPTAGLHVVLDSRVDPANLELVRETGVSEEGPDGTRRDVPAIRLRVGSPPLPDVSEFLNVLTFLADVPFRAVGSLVHRPSLVPETAEDEALLSELGTSDFYAPLGGSTSIRAVTPGAVDSVTLEKLLARPEGLQLYADALSVEHPVAQYREFWRVLESAFGERDDRLVALLASYEPAKEVEFGPDELRALLLLRGRASHAQSSSGIAEVRFVRRECQKRLPRLKTLVERVIATKVTWGKPTLKSEALFRLSGYVGRETDGRPKIVIIRPPTSGQAER